jgi:hypothetical protein
MTDTAGRAAQRKDWKQALAANARAQRNQRGKRAPAQPGPGMIRVTPDLAAALRPHVQALHLNGITTGERYEQLISEIIGTVYQVPDGGDAGA